MNKILFAGIGLVALLSGHAHGQELSTIQPTLNAQCVDTLPLGDGFGWNGRCGCNVEAEWTGFGDKVTVSNNIAAISALDTPENCPGGDETVSIYEKDTSGSWNKSAEFQTNNARYSNNLAFLADDVLRVGFSVFEKQNNGDWLERQTATASVDGEWFGAADSFPGTYVTGTNGRTTLNFSTRDSFGNETGLSTVTTDLGDYFYDVEVSGNIAVAKYFYSQLSSPPNGFALLSRDDAGNWQVDQRVPVAERDREIALRIIGDSVISSGIDLTIWTRDATRVWQQSADYRTSLPTTTPWYVPGAHVYGRRVLLTMPYVFSVLALDINNSWTAGNVFALPEEIPKNVWTGGVGALSGEATRGNVAFGGNEIMIGSPRENLVYILGVADDGEISSSPISNQPSSTGCDYSNANTYGGWGWNPDTQMSCPPMPAATATGCDYTDADLYGGWGWNPDTQMSCPPNEVLTAPNCIDSDGDGWGWDGVMSCVVQDPVIQDGSLCLDTDGDGWGWDGTSSCRV